MKKIGKTLEKPKQNQLETLKQNAAAIHKVLDKPQNIKYSKTPTF